MLLHPVLLLFLSCREILYEIIPKAGTKEVVMALLDQIKSRQLSDDLGAMVISRLGGMSFVSSEYMIKQMMVSSRCYGSFYSYSS